LKYGLIISDDIAKDVYSLHAFDSEWAGTEHTLDRVILFLQRQAIGRAINVCTDVVAGQEALKSFDRGYVKGLHDTMLFLKHASDAGRLLQFPGDKQEVPPRII
jgi:hypothetical protein